MCVQYLKTFFFRFTQPVDTWVWLKNNLTMPSQKQQLRKKLSQLCCIKKCTGVRHRDILQHLNDDSLHLLSEAAHNILISRKENIPPRRIGTLRPLKKELVYLAAPKNSLVKKRKLVATTKGSGIISLIYQQVLWINWSKIYI